MRRRVTLAVAVTLLSALVAGCTPSITLPNTDPVTEPSGSSAGTIAWKDCSSDARGINPDFPKTLRAECGTVTVPRDWKTAKDGKPSDGRTFSIALMRVRSTRQGTHLGSIVLNPGGPGGSGIEYVAGAADRFYGLTSHFDLVGFDPRGVGKSDPVDCLTDEDLEATFGYEPDPVSNASFQGLVALNRRMGEGCGAKYGEDLSLFSTEQAAHDIDAIRIGLGEAKLNYLGFSYGTLLGAVYAQLFPTKIRTMVLDGAVDPTASATASSEGQAMGFERAFNNFTAWCKDKANSCQIADDPRGEINAALNRARTNPVKYNGRTATAGWVFYAVILSLYSQDYWTYLAQAINDIKGGNARLVFALADTYAERKPDGTFGNLFDANNAVNCADGQYPTVDEIRALQSQWRTKYPMMGAPLAVGLLTCSLWPAKKDPYPTGEAKGAPPIVVVGTKGDPATPYESTAKLANMLGVGTVVTWEGEGHTAYPETPCIRRAVEDYFTDVTVPQKDLVCPAK